MNDRLGNNAAGKSEENQITNFRPLTLPERIEI